jgi:hypothetical protein
LTAIAAVEVERQIGGLLSAHPDRIGDKASAATRAAGAIAAVASEGEAGGLSAGQCRGRGDRRAADGDVAAAEAAAVVAAVERLGDAQIAEAVGGVDEADRGAAENATAVAGIVRDGRVDRATIGQRDIAENRAATGRACRAGAAIATLAEDRRVERSAAGVSDKKVVGGRVAAGAVAAGAADVADGSSERVGRIGGVPASVVSPIINALPPDPPLTPLPLLLPWLTMVMPVLLTLAVAVPA